MLSRHLAPALVLFLAPQALAQWTSEAIHTNTVNCRRGNPSGLAFDPSNRPVALLADLDACGGPSRMIWSRKTAGTWIENEIFTNPNSWRLFRGTISLALGADGRPFSQYFGYWPDWQAFGSPVVTTILVDLDAQPNGPGGPTTYLNVYHNCTTYNPTGVLAAGPGENVPHSLVAGSVCQCGGSGYMIDGAVMLGEGFLFRPGPGPNGVAITAIDMVVGAGGIHSVYKYYRCGAESGLYYGNGVPGTQTLINAADGGLPVALEIDHTTGRLHVASVINSAVHHYQSDDQGLTWSAPVRVDPAGWHPDSGLALALTGDGRPAVVFWDSPTQVRMALRQAGGNWTSETVATTAGPSASPVQLAFDNDGRPAVLYYDAPEAVYRLATGAVIGCLADYNQDGFVDGIDYDTFNNDFESSDPLQQMNADVNGDGFVDGIDYDLFNNAFEAGC